MDAAAPTTASAMPPTLQVLHPGDIAWGRRGDCLQTLLGSCVAVLLADPRRTVGAMCHVVHAGTDTTSLPRLYALLRAQGLDPQRCDAWVIGGGNMFPSHFPHDHVGQANARLLRQALHTDGIRIEGEDLGGAVYRRVGWTIGPEPPRVTAVAISE